MPRIFDNIETDFQDALKDTLAVSLRSDICVGYFNLRGWKAIDSIIDQWSGEQGNQCRLLVGMQRLPQEQLLESFSLLGEPPTISQAEVIRLKQKLAQEFRTQLTIGAPTALDESGLRKLASQLRSRKVVVKLFLRHQLHAKLYLCFRADSNNPRTAFLGSSNLTLGGLSRQGELNVDVLDHDSTSKLEKWFNDRWDDRWCLDITEELIKVIEESWARIDPPPPYHVYVKMAYHLAEEARAGLSEFSIPADMRGTLLDFQAAAVKIAARHLEKRGGVILGDVVGLGKTIMATALARVFQDPPRSLETLIICPKNLVKMWEDYAHKHRLLAKIVSLTQVQRVLPELRRYRVLIIDESHNLRNRDGQRWRVIRDYIQRNGCRCILLSATPYNKHYNDLANQLRLFIEPDDIVGVRPEEYLRERCGGMVDQFTKQHQCPVNSLAAFEKTDYADDWRELMRLYMVRRTRSFVQKNYSFTECAGCGSNVAASMKDCPSCGKPVDKDQDRFLILEGDRRFSFPKRVPLALKFKIREKSTEDQYAKLYSDKSVDTIRALHLPRYGLGNYLEEKPLIPPDEDEKALMKNLSRAGNQLIGFCKINLFKRLESSGHSFLVSLRRHILRNNIYLHALKNDLPLPIGTQDAALFDTQAEDSDGEGELFEQEDGGPIRPTETNAKTLEDFARAGDASYNALRGTHQKKFDWIRPDLFRKKDLIERLRLDAERLFGILETTQDWDPARDEKLKALLELIKVKHPKQKILIFSQFSDTVEYLKRQLELLGVSNLGAVTGDHDDPSSMARLFSPVSNGARDEVKPVDELRVLLATDVLSEGQNLQDAAIIVNFDMPWAIIRLIQRAGRVDRIGQTAREILCYSFIPAEGVEQIIRLRHRVVERLRENAKVVGTDERFFEEEKLDDVSIGDLFTEKSGILDDPEDNEVDLASLAYQIWKNASDLDPSLRKTIPDLANVVFSTKSLYDVPPRPEGSTHGVKPESGVMVYVRTADGTDALAWLDEAGKTVTESQHEILRAAACDPSTPALQRLENHHELVKKSTEMIHSEHRSTGGELGRPGSARRRLYERLKDYATSVQGSLFDTRMLHSVLDAIYESPLTESSRDLINRELRAGSPDEKLAELAISLQEEDRLCLRRDDVGSREPHIICSMGIRKP